MGLDLAGPPSMDVPPLDPGLLVFLLEESERLGFIS